MRFVGRLIPLLSAVAAILVSAPAVASDFELLKLDGAYVKWGAPVFASGAEVSYAYVREPVELQGAHNCGAMVSPTAITGKSGIPFDAFDTAVGEAFAQWSAVANLRFHKVDDPARADILIGAQAKPVGIAFANVAPSRTAVAGRGEARIASMKKAAICFNPTLAWTLESGRPDLGRDLFLVAGHEIGHTLGLDHPGPRGARMAFKEGFVSRTLQDSDIRAVQTLYGPRPTN